MTNDTWKVKYKRLQNAHEQLKWDKKRAINELRAQVITESVFTLQGFIQFMSDAQETLASVDTGDNVRLYIDTERDVVGLEVRHVTRLDRENIT